jgi:hypothetical protein
MEEIRIRDEKNSDPGSTTLIMTFNVFFLLQVPGGSLWLIRTSNFARRILRYTAFCLPSLF